MEIELKFSIKDADTSMSIWMDDELGRMEEPGTRRIDEYCGVYYDTIDYTLLNNDIAFRIREEGPKHVASLKWNGQNLGSLHTREELNIKLTPEEAAAGPKPAYFKESEIGPELMALLEGKELIPLMTVNVLRKTFRVDTGKSLLEVCIDEGEIVTDQGCEPVHELEIELYSGDQEELEKLGRRLESKYQVSPERNSKFARGLSLLGALHK